jgi:hypothetical protein
MKKVTQLIKNQQRKMVLGGGLMLASSSAFSALPAAVGTAFTALQTDAMALIDLAWTVVVPVTIAFVILRMFRRAASSVT